MTLINRGAKKYIRKQMNSKSESMFLITRLKELYLKKKKKNHFTHLIVAFSQTKVKNSLKLKYFKIL